MGATHVTDARLGLENTEGIRGKVWRAQKTEEDSQYGEKSLCSRAEPRAKIQSA